MNDKLMVDAERFSAFMTKHYPPAREWEDPVGYCAWYISKGYTAVVVDEDGEKIVAMCAMRPVDRPGFGVLPFYFNEEGKSLHIDLLIDTLADERAIMAFRQLFWMRFGKRKTVAMFRGPEESIHVYDYAKFWRHLTKMKRARIKKKENRNGIESITTTSA
jgi:hypothetical protein